MRLETHDFRSDELNPFIPGVSSMPVRTHAVRLGVVASESATVTTNAVFSMDWSPISPPWGRYPRQ
jgi:hypothetical protein